jgi:hypothetical protein
LGIAILTLNCGSGIVVPFLVGVMHGSMWGFYQCLTAYWIAIIGASAFLYCSVLTIQGFTALLLPRRIFLRLSAFSSLAAFGLFLGVYFLQPSLTTPAEMATAQNHWILEWSPSYWFFGLFNQMNGTLLPQLSWLAYRAWIGIGAALSGAVACLLLCYMRTMKKTIEEPDLVPGAHGLHWMPRFGGSLQTAVALFSASGRSPGAASTALRLHFISHLCLALHLVGCAANCLPPADLRSLPTDFLMSTFMMMTFAVFGLRSVFALPVSLTANWVLRTTHFVRRSIHCRNSWISAAVFGTAGVAYVGWLFHLVSTLPARLWRIWRILALLGWILAELCLIGFYKVPFTCSYLPGKSNIQLVFWAFFFVCLPLAVWIANVELDALHHPLKFVCMAPFSQPLPWGFSASIGSRHSPLFSTSRKSLKK